MPWYLGRTHDWLSSYLAVFFCTLSDKHGKLVQISRVLPETMPRYLVSVIYIFAEPDAVLILAVPKIFTAIIHKTTPGQTLLRFRNGKIANTPRVLAIKTKAISLAEKTASALVWRHSGALTSKLIAGMPYPTSRAVDVQALNIFSLIQLYIGLAAEMKRVSSMKFGAFILEINNGSSSTTCLLKVFGVAWTSVTMILDISQQAEPTPVIRLAGIQILGAMTQRVINGLLSLHS